MGLNPNFFDSKAQTVLNYCAPQPLKYRFLYSVISFSGQHSWWYHEPVLGHRAGRSVETWPITAANRADWKWSWGDDTTDAHCLPTCIGKSWQVVRRVPPAAACVLSCLSSRCFHVQTWCGVLYKTSLSFFLAVITVFFKKLTLGKKRLDGLVFIFKTN